MNVCQREPRVRDLRFRKLGTPVSYEFEQSAECVKKYDLEDFMGELDLRNPGPDIFPDQWRR